MLCLEVCTIKTKQRATMCKTSSASLIANKDALELVLEGTLKEGDTARIGFLNVDTIFWQSRICIIVVAVNRF